MPSSLRRSGLLAALLLAVVPAAAAWGASIKPSSTCTRWIPSVGGEGIIGILGSGWRPGEGTTEIGYSTGRLGFATPAGDGTLAVRIPVRTSFRAPSVVQGNYGVYARDVADPNVFAETRVDVVKITVDTPKTARPRSKVKFRFYGFPNNRRIWAHYSYGGKRRALTDMGRTKGACGKVSKTQRYLPAKVRYGKWYVYYANTRSFAKAKKRFVIRGSFTVHKVFGRRVVPAVAPAIPHLLVGRGARALVASFVP